MALQICLEAAIRLLFEILKFGLDHLLFVIILASLLILRKTGLFIIAGLGLIIEVSLLFTNIPLIKLIAFPILGTTAFLRLAWIYAMMVVISEAKPIVKVVSVIPIALMGALIQAILAFLPIPIITIILAFALNSKRIADIFLAAVTAGFVFLIILANSFVCGTFNDLLTLIQNVRQQGVLQLTGIGKYF